MTARLSTEDKAMITHYLIEKGDITLWSDYENKRYLIENELPQLAHAIKMCEIANKTLRAVLRTI